MRHGLAIGAALLVAASAAPSRAWAAACCGSGHGVGPVLTDSERAAFTLGLGAAARLGQWSYRGVYRPLGGGNFDRELRSEVSWIVRVLEPLQLGVALPMSYAFKRMADTSSTGGGVGDITAFARFDLVESRPNRWFPGIALTLSALVPTGLPLARSNDPLGADATGLGTAEIRPGVAIEKRWLAGFSATVLASLGIRFGYHIESGGSGGHVSPAPRLSLLAAGGPFFPFGLSASVGILFEREAAPSIDGNAATSAARGKTAAVAFLAYDLAARWTAFASAQLDLPISGLGQNEPLAFTPILGIRRVWGIQD
jgi:hypothetical protein